MRKKKPEKEPCIIHMEIRFQSNGQHIKYDILNDNILFQIINGHEAKK